MQGKITIVLPVDDGDTVALALATRRASLRGATLGFVDNGLWRSMSTIVDVVSTRARADGATRMCSTPFDHLAAEFTAQRDAIATFGQGVDIAIAGLGN